jgi:hypothetical protein
MEDNWRMRQKQNSPTKEEMETIKVGGGGTNTQTYWVAKILCLAREEVIEQKLIWWLIIIRMGTHT